VANGHNEKISKAVEISEQVLTKIGNEPQKVEVVNTPQHPVPTSETP
jgi:ribosomal 50S subunit-recycling heat shock protein